MTELTVFPEKNSRVTSACTDATRSSEYNTFHEFDLGLRIVNLTIHFFCFLEVDDKLFALESPYFNWVLGIHRT